MRIAVWHDLPSGGGARALRDQVAGLRSRGHAVDIWTTPYADHSLTPVSASGDQRVVPMPMLCARRTWRPVPPAPIIWDRLRAIRRHLREVAVEVDRGGYDVVLAGASQFVRAAPLASYVNAPAVLYLGEPYRWLYEALPDPPFAAGRRRRPVSWLTELVKTEAMRVQIRAEVEAAARYARVLVNSYFSRESVLRAYGLPADVCYLGVDAAAFARWNVPREDVIVGVGAVVPEKNVEFVLRAVGLMPTPRPIVRWVGNVRDDGYLAYLRSVACELNVNLEVLVGVDDAQLRMILSRARVMAYAPRLEPFGLAPLEGAAAELPVVAIREGGVRETVRDGVTGFLVDSEREMAHRLAQILGDESLQRRLGQAAVTNVKRNWSTSEAVSRLEALLVSVLSSGSDV